MKRYGNPDYMLYAAAVVATLFGVIAVWDAGYAEAAAMGQMLPRSVITQGLYGIAGLVGAWGISQVAPRRIRQIAVPGMILISLLLVGVLFLGKEINGATRWYRFGPFSFQPSEVAKVFCIISMAAGFAGLTPWVKPKWKNSRQWIGHVLIPKIQRAWPLLPVLIVVGLIEMQPDLKTACVISVTAGFMLWAAGVSKKSFALLGICAVVFAGAAIVDKPYRLTRLLSHSDRWSENKIDSIGFQTTQSETALAMGGVMGKGFGEGRAKYTLPEPTNDFILATIGEELGLFGSLLVIGLLGFITWRIYSQGMMRVDRFERLTMVGVSVWIGVQTVTNVVVTNGAVPVMGVPLPFFSSGGTSLFALWLGIGVVQAVVSSPNVVVEEGLSLENEGRAVRSRAAYVK